MAAEIPCPSCYGTGTFPGPYDTRPGFPAHQYEVVCGCGAWLDVPGMNRLNYQIGSLLPFSHHKLAIARAAGCAAWVDAPLVGDIERLWEAGIETFSSCQGGVPGYPHRFVIIRSPDMTGKARELLPWAASAKNRGNDVVLSAERPADSRGDGLGVEWVRGSQTVVSGGR